MASSAKCGNQQQKHKASLAKAGGAQERMTVTGFSYSTCFSSVLGTCTTMHHEKCETASATMRCEVCGAPCCKAQARCARCSTDCKRKIIDSGADKMHMAHRICLLHPSSAIEHHCAKIGNTR